MGIEKNYIEKIDALKKSIKDLNKEMSIIEEIVGTPDPTKVKNEKYNRVVDGHYETKSFKFGTSLKNLILEIEEDDSLSINKKKILEKEINDLSNLYLILNQNYQISLNIVKQKRFEAMSG